MNAKLQPVSVRIMGKEYLISCPPEEQEALLSSAKQVDDKMKELRNSGKVVGTDRLAVMAALNIAHENLNSSDQLSNIEKTTVPRLTDLEKRIHSSLNKLR